MGCLRKRPRSLHLAKIMLAIRRTSALAATLRSPSNNCSCITHAARAQNSSGTRHLATKSGTDFNVNNVTTAQSDAGELFAEEVIKESPPNPFSLDHFKLSDRTTDLVEPELHKIHIKSTSNNTCAVFTHGPNIIGWASGGSVGFKNAQRSTYEAGYQVAKRMIEMVAERARSHRISLEIVYNGFGQGRDAMASVLLTAESESIRPYIVRLTDKTPIRIGGPRQPKVRRL